MELSENEKRLLNTLMDRIRESRVNELNELSKATGIDVLKVIGSVDEIDRINFEYYPSGAVKEITVHPCASFLTHCAEFDEDENLKSICSSHVDEILDFEEFHEMIEKVHALMTGEAVAETVH